jgi:hypothetical protein
MSTTDRILDVLSAPIPVAALLVLWVQGILLGIMLGGVIWS